MSDIAERLAEIEADGGVVNGFDGDYVRYIASADMGSDIDPTGDFRTFIHVLFLTLQQMAQRIIALEGEGE